MFFKKYQDDCKARDLREENSKMTQKDDESQRLEDYIERI
jgi:hypothetical protein